MVLLLHLLLVIALAALAGAALRLASLIAPSGLERLLTVAVLIATAAVLESLAAGIFGLGGTSIVLTAAAVLTWLAARTWLPAPEVGASAELLTWWSRLTTAPRAALGALAGGWLALAAIVLHRPEPGFDGIIYHIPEVVEFVQSGHPGTVLTTLYQLPVGNYPLTNEVLLAWLTGISHGLAALTLWTPVAVVLMVMAGWLGLRRLGVAPAVRALALAALLAGPQLVVAFPQPTTDLTSLTWLVCAAALATAAPNRPIMLAPTMLALGLAIGTKTTPAVYGLILLAGALWSCRGRLAPIRRRLALAAVTAFTVGGIWYVRDLIQHGSPSWPIVATPWGDPLPPLVKLVSSSMLSHLRVTLLDHLSFYLSLLSGSAALLLGGVVLGLLAGRRRTVLAGAAVALGALAWASAPVTGRPNFTVLTFAAATSVRYMMPVLAAGALALALVASDGPRWARPAAILTLLGSLVWALDADIPNRFYLPFDSWLPAGALLGAVAVILGEAVARGFPAVTALLTRERRRVGALLAVAAVAISAAVLAAGSANYLVRHSTVGSELDSTIAGYLARQPGFASGARPVAFAPYIFGPLAGDSLSHRISLIGESEPCARVLASTRRGWVVLTVVTPHPVPGHPGLLYPSPETAQSCLAHVAPRFENSTYRVYGDG